MQTRITRMIDELFDRYIPGIEWTFNKRLRKSIGRCHFIGEAIRVPVKIDFAYYFFRMHSENEKLLRGIVLHEIAHALVREPNHGDAFVRKCLEIGGIPDPKLTAAHFLTSD